MDLTTTELNRTQAPRIRDAVEFDLRLKPYDYYKLSNGAPVYAINAGAEDVIQLEWVFYAGNWYEEKNLVAASTNFMIKNGTKSKSAFAINEHFEYYGAYLNRACYNETSTVTLHSLSRHLPVLLPVVREILTESVFPEEEFQTYRQNMKQRLNVNLKKSDFVAGRLIDTYLYGENHPYGKFSSFEDFDALTRQELEDFFNRYYKGGRFVLFVAGKLPEDIFQQLEANFGDLPYADNRPSPIISKRADEKKYRVINDPQGVQGAIRIATPFPNRHHPDFLKAQVLNTLFGGFFGSRLMSNIREDKGYTYGIYSYLENHIQETAWVISTDVGREVSEAAIVEVYKEMARLRDEDIDAEELQLVQNYMMGSILGDLDGPFQIINRWKNIILNEVPEDYFYRQIETIRNITAADLKEIAGKYLKEENFYELVVV